ncbi:flippase [Piscinibacter gummiphilus]|nr:flippase [Piscinibacter gummiphilus]GLS97677.1 O-unit flippase [Piscinibacter gummiphilus]
MAVPSKPTPEPLRQLFALIDKLRHATTGSAGRRAVTANSGWLLFDKLTRSLLGLLVGAWVARHLGPTQFGLLAYVLAFIALFQAIANLGADAIIVRDIAQHPDSAPEILGTALGLRAGFGVLCWAVAVGCVAALNADAPRTILMAAIVGSVLVFQASDTVDLWFQSQSRSRLTVFAKLSAYLLSNGIKVGLILCDAPLEAFAAVTAFDALACTAGLFMAYRRMRTPQRWRFVLPRATRLAGEAWPFMLSGVSIMVYARIDQIMIKEILGDHSLGIYAAALPLSQFWQVIPLTLATSLAPFIARRKIADERDYQRSLVLVFRAFFYMGVGCAAFTWLVSGILVIHLFGPAFAEATHTLNVHAISNVFCFLGVAHGLWLVNERRFAVRLYGTLLAGLTTIAMNMLLLPRLGTVGAAYAAIAAQFVAAVLINLFLDPRSFRMQCDAIFFRKV